jgi:heterodisulfide reductase subunit C/nitrate reductase gamma subunit
MMKRPLAGLLHALVWWGFLVITIGSLEMIIDGLTDSSRIFSPLSDFYFFVTASGDIFAALIVLSCIIFLSRRYIIKPKRFIAPEMKPSSRADATFILSLILILMLTLLGMNTAYIASSDSHYSGSFPVSYFLTPLFSSLEHEQVSFIEKANWWTHIVIIYFFLNFLPYSKHFHVFASVPNVFFTRLEPYAKLGNMESVKREVQMILNPALPAEAGPPPARFGVKDAEDVTWKTLLDSYTCTECGRCTAVCPANTTGKLLSPRKLFIDLRRRMKDKSTGLINTGKDFTDSKSLIGTDYITEQELWACTTCMACIEECPVDIDHVPFIVDMRRNLVMEESKVPAQLGAMFSNIENNGAPWAFARDDRMNWASDIEIKTS